MGYAILGVLVVVAGVLAFFAKSSWRWANLVLAALIVPAAACFIYLAGYTLKVHASWRSLANKQQVEIEKEDAARITKLEGLRNEQGQLENGLHQLTQQVADLIVDRGPVWLDVASAKKPTADGIVEVTVEAPEPHGITKDSVVYLFDSATAVDGGKYLGEFVVSDAPADATNVTLRPSAAFSPEELKLLQASSGEWTLYLKMPTDENAVFAALDDEQAAKIIPEDLPEEVRQGKRDEEDLSDYSYAFANFQLQRGLLADSIAKLKVSIGHWDEAEKRNQARIEYREGEKANLALDKAGFKTEAGAVKQYALGLDSIAKKLAKEVADTRAHNAQLAAKLKEVQLKAAAEINRRSETASSE